MIWPTGGCVLRLGGKGLVVEDEKGKIAKKRQWIEYLIDVGENSLSPLS